MVVDGDKVDKQDNTGVVYSVALMGDESAPTINSAHEQAMATLRDTMMTPSFAFDPALYTDRIQPSKEFLTLQSENQPDPLPSQVDCMEASTKGTKTTTATDFFAKSEPPASSRSTKKGKSGNVSTTNIKKSIFQTSSQESKNSKKPKLSEPNVKEESLSEKKPRKKSKPSVAPGKDVEKENTANSLAVKKKKTEEKKSKAVGNADDFVGDEDEDEDFEREDVERRKRNEKEARMRVREEATRKRTKVIQRKSTKQVDEDADDQDSTFEQSSTSSTVAVVGAMDSFTTQKTSQPNVPAKKNTSSAPSKKKRKKLTEETFADDQGYLQTKTVTIWEDVPSDEEPEKPPLRHSTVEKSKPASNGPKKQMKQVGLMGFFGKKK
eukprot:scaffold81381_cov57-Attheya_sp.AAC.1